MAAAATRCFKDLHINAHKFSYVVNKLRSFFLSKGLVEAHTQNRLNIVSACEDPSTISIFRFANHDFPLVQTQQMNLERLYLKNPSVPGYFTIGTSYRDEKNPVPGRHMLVFPMAEFELGGNFNDLQRFEEEMLRYLGYKCRFDYGKWADIAKKYNTDDITHKHENQIYKDGSTVFFLSHFPEHTSPFWNMKRNPDGTADKIDVILSGHESFGSAVRSCDVDQMRRNFLTISNGEYAGILFKKFGKKRVMDEIDEFLSLPFIPRFGGGIGMTRLISSMEKEGLIPGDVLANGEVD
jgi:hypothetical protein